MDGRRMLDRAWAVLVSMRTSAALLVALAALMLANAVVPQESVSPDAYQALLERGPIARFLLETAGLGHVSTSLALGAVLWLFFLSLAAVLADRTGATVRRLRASPPTAAQVRALVDRGGLEIAPDRGWSPESARHVLEGLGYRVASAGAAALWGVRHAAAVLGFPLFHLSFFVLCAAGVQLYQTREVGVAIAAEGQRIDGRDVRVVRRAPSSGAPPLDLVVERVDVRLDRGRPVEVAASLRSAEPGAPPRVARVNHPAVWGDLTVLVESVGLAPVLSLVDARGYTRDRVALVVTSDGGPATVPLSNGRVRVTVEPIPLGERFPERPALATVPLRTRVQDGERVAFDAPLAPRVAVPLGDVAVRLDEVRYWARLRLVHERGGGLLVLGFVLLVVGIVWRMVWFRREVVVSWGDGVVRVGGRAEFYPARFREELDGIRDLLESPQRVGLGEERRSSG